VQVALFEELFAEAYRRVVGVGEEGVLDDDACPTTCLENFYEVLKKEEGCFAGFDGKVLLDLFAFFAAEGWVGKHDVVAVFVLNVVDVFGKGVGMKNVWRFDAVQNHVHDCNDVGQRFLFLAEEGVLLKDFYVLRGEFFLRLHVVVRFAQEACRANCPRRRCVRLSVGLRR